MNLLKELEFAFRRHVLRKQLLDELIETLIIRIEQGGITFSNESTKSLLCDISK